MLTELQTKKLARYFQVYDVDDDGRIGPGDFERVLENIRILHGLDEGSADHEALRRSFIRRWEALRASADIDDDGGVDLPEWLRYWAAAISEEDEYEEVVTALVSRLFEAFDTDEDGRLGPDEYCNFFAVYGLSADLARSMFARLDVNGDGTISHDELVEHAHAFYRGDDPSAAGNLLFGPYD
jgi:Ca2+-binding EF-hand superfamily protein